MRITSFVAASLFASLFASPALAQPTTQACLGDIDTFLACPPGAQRTRTECRVREPGRGNRPGEHWSGSKRQGPALFLRDDRDPKSSVSFAAYYKDHKKTGRVYRFDKQGRLESWVDVAADKYHGLRVSCRPDGRVSDLAYFKNDVVVGVSRAWMEADGTLSYAMDHDAQGRAIPIAATPELQKRPDHLCRPVRCDVTAKPDLSGIPK